MKHQFLLFIALLCSVSTYAQDKPKEAYPFESEIKAFKSQDSIGMPKAGGMLFIGSSSIRKWVDLPAHFPNKSIIMRGVGGSKIVEWVKYYMPSVVYPYNPSKIFIYVGDNDIAAGSGAQSVYDNFVLMLSMIREHLPKAKVYFLSMKLSPSRSKYYNEVALGDMMITAYIKTQKDVYYIDVNTTLLTPKSLPDSVLFQKDMLHLNPTGYEHWEKVIADYISH
ncbi:MAG: GDSL-type esterase/lipase family protein [Bacteroidota bacterium]